MTMAKRLSKSKTKQEKGRFRVREEKGKDWLQERPIFSLQYLQAGYCVDDCARDERAAFASALWRRSQLTWQEINQAGRHALGSEIIDQNSINVSIPIIVTPDVKLLSFRYNGIKPMIGFKSLNVFHVIWIDPQLNIYNH